jgi:hypothetical protein
VFVNFFFIPLSDLAVLREGKVISEKRAEDTKPPKIKELPAYRSL